MCQLLKFRSSAMNGKIVAIYFVFIFCFAECAAGTCLNYGHSCWGAHGKRNEGLPNNNFKGRADSLADTRWILSRLLQAPLNAQSWKNRNDGALEKRAEIDSQLFNINEGRDEQDGEMSEVLPSNEDIYYLDEPSSRTRTIEDKIRLFKLIKKNAGGFN